jgi:hypothetical protein
VGTLSLDASSPASVYLGTGTSTTTASFTPPANSRVIVCLRYNTGSGDTPGTPTITDNLGVHLTYTLVADNRRGVINPPPDADAGIAIWKAVGTGAAMTVTAGSSGTASTGVAIKVLVWTDSSGSTPDVGPNKTQTGAGSATGTNIFSTSTLASSTGGCGLLAGVDWLASAVPTAGSGCTVTGGDAAQQGSNMSYCVIIRSLNDTVSGSNFTVTGSWGATSTNARWSTIEITPAAGTPIADEGMAQDSLWWPGDGPMQAERFLQQPMSTETPGDAIVPADTVIGFVTISVTVSADSIVDSGTIAPPTVTISGSFFQAVQITPATIAPPAVTISGTPSTGSTVSPATISPVKVVISGTPALAVQITPATIAPPVVTISGTAQGGAAPAPATISPVKVVISGTASAGSIATPATISPPVVVISGTAQTGSTVTPATISPPVAVISGTVASGNAPATIAPPVVAISGTPATSSTVSPATIAPPVVVISGTAHAGATATPGTIAPPTVVIGPHSAAAGSAVLPGTVAPPKVVVSGTAVTGSVSAPATIAPPTVVISGAVIISKTVVVSTVAPPVVVIGSVTLTSAVLVVVSTISPPPVTIGPHLFRAGAVALVATILGLTNITAPTFTSGYVDPGDRARVTGDPGTAGVTGDVLPSRIDGTDLTAGVF